MNANMKREHDPSSPTTFRAGDYAFVDIPRKGRSARRFGPMLITAILPYRRNGKLEAIAQFQFGLAFKGRAWFEPYASRYEDCPVAWLRPPKSGAEMRMLRGRRSVWQPWLTMVQGSK